uniref:Uncharacterized protein n=1 Tax=Rodentolepis nana TaxID=102285 RepID=A0A158QHA2_RODNA
LKIILSFRFFSKSVPKTVIIRVGGLKPHRRCNRSLIALSDMWGESLANLAV